MTELLNQAMAAVANLPDAEQDALAQWKLETLESERRWDELFARSSDKLAQLAEEALAELRAGETQPQNARHG